MLCRRQPVPNRCGFVQKDTKRPKEVFPKTGYFIPENTQNCKKREKNPRGGEDSPKGKTGVKSPYRYIKISYGLAADSAPQGRYVIITVCKDGSPLQDDIKNKS